MLGLENEKARGVASTYPVGISPNPWDHPSWANP